MENSHFVFHLNKLIKEELVIKADGYYSLSQTGKELANRMNTAELTFDQIPKTTTMLCIRKKTNHEHSYLVLTRKKNPNYGQQCFPTHKVWFGNSITKTAEEGLQLKTGLEGQPELITIRHYRDYHKESNQLLEDKIMYIFKFDEPQGELKECEQGEWTWVKESELKTFITHPLPDFFEIVDTVRNFSGNITFKEAIHLVAEF